MRDFFSHDEKITNVSQFTALIADLHKTLDEIYNSDAAKYDIEGKEIYFYHGLSNLNYELKASIYRTNNDLYDSEYDIFKEVLHIFPEDFYHDSNVIEKLIRMQHYEIPTRLIDVTYNPLVALFFAAGGFRNIRPDRDGRIIFFSSKPKSIIFSDEIIPSLLIGLEQKINVDLYFIDALSIFSKLHMDFNESLDVLPESDFKNSTIKLFEDINKKIYEYRSKSITTFLHVFLAINNADNLFDQYNNFWVRRLNNEYKDFFNLLMSTYLNYSRQFIAQKSNELLPKIDSSKFFTLSQFFQTFVHFTFIKPKMSNKRIIRQQGAFLIHPRVLHHYGIDKLKISSYPNSITNVSDIIIDRKSKPRILKELRELGITYSYLFPDLDKYHAEISLKYSAKLKPKAVYFAGPDIFSPDYPQTMNKIKELCTSVGLSPLLPGDLELNSLEAISQHNLSLIDQADGIIANLNPFRGVIEPDSGTVFECAYAFAKGKPVIGYLDDRQDMLTKLRKTEIGPPSDGTVCPDGTWVEDFDLPLNLMLYQGLTAVAGSLKDAIELAASYKKPGEST